MSFSMRIKDVTEKILASYYYEYPFSDLCEVRPYKCVELINGIHDFVLLDCSHCVDGYCWSSTHCQICKL